MFKCSMCDATKHLARGMCHRCYHRERNFRLTPIKRARPTLEERLLAKTVRNMSTPLVNGQRCLDFTGSKDANGYGDFYIGNRPDIAEGRHSGANRVAHTLWVGPLRDGEFACHHCDRPQCIEPGHLFAGKPIDNSADMAAKMRGKMGLEHHGAKLSDEQVLIIRNSPRARGSGSALAREFGVDRSCISAIRAGNQRPRLRLDAATHSEAPSHSPRPLSPSGARIG